MDSHEEIMEATNSAFEKHSYSSLSIQNIADEFEKSKSLLYHHYDGKDEILLDFLDYMLEGFREEALSQGSENVGSEFRSKAFMAFDICQGCDYLKTLVELRTQALRDERYEEKFERFEHLYTEKIVELFEKGRGEEFAEDIETGKVADFIVAVNYEALRLKAADKEVSGMRKELEAYLEFKVF
jgi:AcrR family transcriptional regulator